MPEYFRKEIIVNSSVIVSVITVIGSFTLVYLNSIKDSSDRKYNVRKE